ncbi:hypothetical protein OSB04_004443 [Centaurea solstitialis]|uniref:Uncharacterized protein n=1 Tax=Centaurea solstitialis TaxID=347529 RepID=A0AA38WPR1_9ASTR|nr:hypothetical protein OSB04_004443 [Centaurea solstitialis]
MELRYFQIKEGIVISQRREAFCWNYLAHTRPDIVVSQHMNYPCEEDLYHVNQTLRYLKATPGLGQIENMQVREVTKQVEDPLQVSPSMFGAILSLVGVRNKFLFLMMSIGSWYLGRNLAANFQTHSRSPTFSEDVYQQLRATISIAKNHVHHDKTKHIEINRHFTSEEVNTGSLN